jgi:hypothetical protein
MKSELIVLNSLLTVGFVGCDAGLAIAIVTKLLRSPSPIRFTADTFNRYKPPVTKSDSSCSVMVQISE